MPDHRPDHPFGCTVSWGQVIGGGLPDMQRHVCNLPPHATGEHRCKCGDRRG